MYTRIVFSMLLAGLVSGTALGQSKGEPAPDFEIEGEGSLEDLRGYAVVLLFWHSGDTTSVDALGTVQQIVTRFEARGVRAIGVTRQTKQDAESVVKGRNITYDVGYGPGIFRLYDVPALPRVYLIDPRGLVWWRGHPDDDLAQRVQQMMKETKPRGSDAKLLEEKLRAAQEAWDNEDLGRAYTRAKQVVDSAGSGSPLATQAQQLVDTLESEAEKRVEEVKKLRRRKDYDEACKLAAEVQVRFEGTDAASEMESEIGRLRADRDAKAKMNKALENERGEVKLDEANDLAGVKEYVEAVNVYRQVVDEHSGTESAKAAKAALEQIRSDSRIQKFISAQRATAQADRWLDIGDRAAKVELYALARKHYQLVLDEHPSSSAASKARRRLAKLPADEEAVLSSDEDEGDDDG